MNVLTILLYVSLICSNTESLLSYRVSSRYSQNSSTYYSFAYTYGNNHVLLITEVEKLIIPPDKHISSEVLLYNFVRDNDVKFKKFIRSHYPVEAANFNKTSATIVYEQEKEKLLLEWNKKVNANKGKVIYVKDFEFDKVIQDQPAKSEGRTEIK